MGVAAWLAPDTRRGMMSALVRRPEAVSLIDERIGRRSLRAMRLRQERLARQGVGRLIVSEPAMIGMPAQCFAQERLYPWPGERLGRFLPAFEDRCDRIVLTIRAYDRFWASLMAQAVVCGHPLPSRALLDRLVLQPLRWRRLVEEVASCFPHAEVLVLPFERLAGMPERQLAAMLGRPLPLGVAGHMAGVRDWHRRSPSTPHLGRVLSDHSGSLPGPLSVDVTGRWQPFDDVQRAAFAEHYAEDLAWLRSGANGRATLIATADASELRTVDRTEGRQPDDRKTATTGVGGTGHEGVARPLS
ncbi:hypothetical protein [Tropicimonas sediminicola]|uniref:hypothetical protein n=1 Tax=Tropicimonas sediminicola TaxID=1031541 RepID=UPI001130ADCC|nr:hypothetical protein [Tropicimonas sediminicola]